MYQQITIIGNVGRDPEMNYTPNGVAVCKFTVAVNRKWKTETGEPREKTTWFRVAAWRNLGETCNQFVHKGMRVMVVGEIEASAYTGKDGTAQASLELTAKEIKFLSRVEAVTNEGQVINEDDGMPF